MNAELDLNDEAEPTPDDAREERVDPLVVAVNELKELVSQFAILVTDERKERKVHIHNVLAAERRARRRGYGIIFLVFALFAASISGYMRNEAVISCNRANTTKKAIREAINAAVDEVGDHVEVSDDQLRIIIDRVDARTEVALPSRDCHWF